MKNKILALLAVLTFAVGCHGQVPVTPPVVSLPVAGNGAYTPLNPSGTSGLTYTDSPSGTVGYVVQGYIPSSGSTPAQYGQWSNVVGPVAGGATGKVTLSWTCTAGSGQTCSGVLWIVSRASAVTALAPATPVPGSPTTSMLDMRGHNLDGAIPAVTLTAKLEK